MRCRRYLRFRARSDGETCGVVTLSLRSRRRCSGRHTFAFRCMFVRLPRQLADLRPIASAKRFIQLPQVSTALLRAMHMHLGGDVHRAFLPFRAANGAVVAIVDALFVYDLSELKRPSSPYYHHCLTSVLIVEHAMGAKSKSRILKLDMQWFKPRRHWL